MNKFFLLLIVIFCSLLSGEITLAQNTTNQNQNQNQNNSQNYQFNSQKINSDLPNLLSSFSSMPIRNSGAIEGTIDPDKYIIGANDIFLLGLYGYINQQLELIVNMEGTVIIPSVGEIYINGNTLSEAKAKVVSTVKKRYYSSDVSFNLVSARTFYINITGLVQGKYYATSLTRASEMLKYILIDTTNISKTSYEKSKDRTVEPLLLKTQMSARNLTLNRKDGSSVKVDLYKYYMTNDEKYNPYLLEGDVLNIPNIMLDKNYISVNGAVQLGGSYEYSEGDDLETVIGVGRGFDFYAEPDSIMLFRPSKSNNGFEIINLSFSKDRNYPIQVFDRVFVKYKSDYIKVATVLVIGEIERPGYYPIMYKTTKLKEVIDLAGGLKKTAYLPLSILFRYWDQEYTSKDSTEIFINQRANDLLVSEKDYKNFYNDIKAKRSRVVIDFEKLITKQDNSQNITLEDKDVIYINDNKNIVYVYGQVNNEGYVSFEPGKNADYYIEKTGSYTLAADKSNTRVIKFNSRGWYKADETEIQSGDYVYVPKKENKSFGELVTIIASISGVILGVLSTYLLIKSSNK